MELKPFDVDKTFNLFNQSKSCPPLSASVKIDVDVKAHAVASIGFVATGTIIPPNFDGFVITASTYLILLSIGLVVEIVSPDITADIDGSVNLVADVTVRCACSLQPFSPLIIPAGNAGFWITQHLRDWYSRLRFPGVSCFHWIYCKL